MNAPPRRTVRITAKQYTTGCAVIFVTGTAPAKADPLRVEGEDFPAH